jgi:hypothetical protein
MATTKKTQEQRDRDARDQRRMQDHPLNRSLAARQPRKPSKKK